MEHPSTTATQSKDSSESSETISSDSSKSTDLSRELKSYFAPELIGGGYGDVYYREDADALIFELREALKGENPDSEIVPTHAPKPMLDMRVGNGDISIRLTVVGELWRIDLDDDHHAEGINFSMREILEAVHAFCALYRLLDE